MNVISLVSYPFLPARSGGQKGIALFYKYFSRHHQVRIITTRNNNSAMAEGYELLNILPDSPSRYINPFIFFTLRKQIRAGNATHLILEHPYYGWLGILLKIFCGIRLVVHSHNIENKRWKSLGKWWWRILWYYEKITHRFADYNFFKQDEDLNYAVNAFGLKPESCLMVSFGTELSAPVPIEKRKASRKILEEQLQVSENIPLLLFNGAFNYKPNREALEDLLLKVNPILKSSGFSYLMLILGLNVPEEIKQKNYPNTRILGYVEDLDLYLTGCQLFLNPLTSGGGIKTKLVEALAAGLSAVSSENGAIGVDPGLCNDKLVICPDHDWEYFAEAILRAVHLQAPTPQSFYDHFYWENIAERAALFIEGPVN
jgi:glycosyltransferase involved in cell wall biosynthesis